MAGRWHPTVRPEMSSGGDNWSSFKAAAMAKHTAATNSIAANQHRRSVAVGLGVDWGTCPGYFGSPSLPATAIPPRSRGVPSYLAVVPPLTKCIQSLQHLFDLGQVGGQRADRLCHAVTSLLRCRFDLFRISSFGFGNLLVQRFLDLT